MKIKTRELNDAALDWAVAKCEGYTATIKPTEVAYVHPNGGWHHNGNWHPATHWAQGGPIIEREEIGSFHYIHGFHGPTWSASIGSGGFQQDGPTLLIAAMRCYCCAKLGDEIEIPQELQPCQQLKT